MDSWLLDRSASTSLPSPANTPTRASRTKGIANETPYTSFVRRSPNNHETTFSVGDTVIIGPHATTRQKFLAPPPYLHGPTAGKKTSKKARADAYEGWRHEDGLESKEKVGVIVGLFEDTARDTMMARVRWFARPGAVWDADGPEAEDVEEPHPYELYYTADSTFVRDAAARKDSSYSPRNRLAHTVFKTALCTDLVAVEHIKAHVEVVSKFDAQHRDSSRTFVVRQVFDVNPVADAEFFGLIDWDEVVGKGLANGEWDTEPAFEKLAEGLAGARKDTPVAKPVRKEVRKEVNVVEAKAKGKGKGKEKEKEVEEVEDEVVEVEDDYTMENSGGEDEDDDAEASDAPQTEDDHDDASEPEDDLPRTPRKRKAKSQASSPKRRAAASVTPRRAQPKLSQVTLQRKASRSKKQSLFQAKKYTSSGVPPPFTETPDFLKMSTFEKAKALLHVSATPESLPRRDEQRSKMSELLGLAILGRTGTCLYVHGVPGTGKTATVHSVVRELQEDEDMDAFQFVEINGMKISEPNQAFTVLWEAVSGHKSAPRQALARLEEHFQTPDPTRKTTVVLVDELDQMITKKQDVIYNFFNWPHVAHSRLIVIAVANTMDLPERELSGKIRSRLGSNRIPFPTYSWQDLEAILEARLDGLEVFKHPSLQRIAKSVAGVSGDARRALDIARRTVEKKDQRNKQDNPDGEPELCTMADVAQTYSEMTNYGSNLFVKRASLHQKIFLLGLSQCIKRAGVPEVSLETVMHWHFDFLRQTAITPMPSHEDLFAIATDLHSLRLVVTDSQRCDYFQTVRSLVEDGDLIGVLKEEPLLKKHLPKLNN